MRGNSGCLWPGSLFLLLAVAVAAWFTHLYVCFTQGEWGFLIAGAIFAPVAVVHGFGAWFGLWS